METIAIDKETLTVIAHHASAIERFQYEVELTPSEMVPPYKIIPDYIDHVWKHLSKQIQAESLMPMP